MKDLTILITMDVERPTSDLPRVKSLLDYAPTGPSTYEESERAIKGYWDVAVGSGFPVTFFIHPEAAEHHRDLFLDLKNEGACLALHLHPWRFDDGRYDGHLGAFSMEEQRRIISEAATRWEAVFGCHPLYFRPGTFSANDCTYRVLSELGFRGGSVSAPGVVWPQTCCVWAGAEMHAHLAHPNFRLLSGSMPFANVPHSVSLRHPVHQPDQFFYRNLGPHYDIDHKEILEEIIRQVSEQRPIYPSVTVTTHNDQGFACPHHPARKRLEVILDSVGPLSEKFSLRPCKDTIAGICEKVLVGLGSDSVGSATA